MRNSPAASHAVHLPQIPRGWVVVVAALASWMLVAVLWTGTTQLFSYVLATI